jgi:virginiamycin B lyase
LWFTNSFGHDIYNGSIGRITTAGAVTNYANSNRMSEPTGIAAGSDGALWFTNNGNNSIGRITTTGVVTSYTDSRLNSQLAVPAGPDGALWVTNENVSIVRVTTAGVVRISVSVVGPSVPQFQDRLRPVPSGPHRCW